MNIEELALLARKLRGEAIDMVYAAQSGHPGSAMSTMDVLVALYFGGILTHDSKKPNWPERDYFLLSNGHACPALYVVLAEAGFFTKEALGQLRQLGAGAQGHPKRGSLPGIEISAGSLGQGLSVAIGLAYAHKLQKKNNRIYMMMSDGEQEEGSTWEAIMLAPKLKLDNLIAIVDKNQFQIDGATRDVMPPLDSLAEKYRAFHWDVLEVDGHSNEEILRTFAEAKKSRGPTVIISHTVRGKGVSFMEGSTVWHAGAMNREQYEQAKAELSLKIPMTKSQ